MLPRAYLLGAHEVHVLARCESHVGFLPRLARAGALTEALLLGRDAHDVHALDLDLEQQLDGLPDVGLRGVVAHAEHDLAAAFGDARGLLGDVRSEQNLHQMFAMGLVAHLSRSSTILSAAAVITTFSAPTKLTGSISCA